MARPSNTKSGFNTQPPEGGWSRFTCFEIEELMFQHTAARRRLARPNRQIPTENTVSTHSRPKAAGMMSDDYQGGLWVSTHSRPKAAGFSVVFIGFPYRVSTHSRPKAAGYSAALPRPSNTSFNTQPPEGGWGQERICNHDDCSFNTQPPEGGWKY